MNILTAMEYIYPSIEIISHTIEGVGTTMSFDTTLRKKHRGKWYLWKINRIWSYKYDFDLNTPLKIFHAEVYNVIILGKINTSLVDMDGNKIFKLDPNQQSEEERLSQFMKLPLKNK
jgi:hypothetical protein